MLGRIWMHCFLAGGMFLSVGAVNPQETTPHKSLPPLPLPPGVLPMGDLDVGPIGDRIELLGFEPGTGTQVVKNAPFSAEAIADTVQTLGDGNRIHRTMKSRLYRDRAGRIRREGTLPTIGPFVASRQERTFTSVYDPVSRTSYILEPDLKIARAMPSLPPLPVGHLKGKLASTDAARSSGDMTVESLGTQTINGVSAEGMRFMWTIAAGQIGNERPIVITFERWYSPDLRLVVMSRRSDPRFGEATYQLRNIQRQDPPASLFQVPSDYTVKREIPPRGALGLPPPLPFSP